MLAVSLLEIVVMMLNILDKGKSAELAEVHEKVKIETRM